MGSRPVGYSYSYKFSLVGLHDIISRIKYAPLMEGDRIFIFEMRTEFFINWSRKVSDAVAKDIIGSERYDIFPFPADDETLGAEVENCLFSPRLREYWMSEDEIKMFREQVMAFAKGQAADRAGMDRIPIAIHFEVCTVQQGEEPWQAVLGRAIAPHKLFPLYLWPLQSSARRPLCDKLMLKLIRLNRTRASTAEIAEDMMPVCAICMRSPHIGDQIAKLPLCGCAFHYHCVVLKLETSNQCPQCKSQVYDSGLLQERPFEYLFEDQR